MSRKRRFNFDDEDSRIPDGSYDAIVVSIEDTTSKAGHDMYIWHLKLPDIGEGLDVYTVLTTAAMWNLKRILSALGLPHEGEVEVDPDECEGRCMVVQVENEEFRGQPSPKAASFDKHPKGPFALREEQEEMRGTHVADGDASDVPF